MMEMEMMDDDGFELMMNRVGFESVDSIESVDSGYDGC